MRNNWELRKRGYLIRFGHTEALLLKKYDIKRPFFPPCRNWPICEEITHRRARFPIDCCSQSTIEPVVDCYNPMCTGLPHTVQSRPWQCGYPNDSSECHPSVQSLTSPPLILQLTPPPRSSATPFFCAISATDKYFSPCVLLMSAVEGSWCFPSNTDTEF